MPLHDYRCPEHGLFESLTNHCKVADCELPVKVVFLKPIGIHSARTRRIDSSLRKTAESFGMTNLGSMREGESQHRNLPRTIAPVDMDLDFQAPVYEEPARPMPENIKWGSFNGITAASTLGGNGELNLGKTIATASPIAQGLNKVGGLAARTQIVNVDTVKRTQNGLVE